MLLTSNKQTVLVAKENNRQPGRKVKKKQEKIASNRGHGRSWNPPPIQWIEFYLCIYILYCRCSSVCMGVGNDCGSMLILPTAATACIQSAISSTAPHYKHIYVHCAMCMCTACSTRIPFTVRLPQRVPSQQTLQLAVSEYIVHFRNGIRDLNVVRSLHQQHAAMWATDISSLCHGKGRQEKKHKKMKQICVYGKHWFCVECVWRGSEGIAMLYGLLVLAFRMLSTVFCKERCGLWGIWIWKILEFAWICITNCVESSVGRTNVA